MRAGFVVVALLGAMGASIATAGEQPFLGIAGEYREETQRETGLHLPGVTAPDTRFELHAGSTRELDRDAGRTGSGADPFYRETIFSGQRAERVDGTGLTIFDRIFGID
ncbi:MAG: hypothetical protein AAF409_02825 [Pseudomonadota bacterium]